MTAAIDGPPVPAREQAPVPSSQQTPPLPSDQDAPPDRPVNTGSLRNRVVLSVVVLLAVLLAVLGVVVSTLLGDALRADLKQRLADTAGYAVVLQQQGVTGQTLADQMSSGGIYSTFSSAGEQFIGRDQGPPAPAETPGRAGTPPGGPPAAPLPQPAVEPDVSFTESAGLLTAEVTLPDGTLQLQASENEIDHTLSVLRTIELIAGAAALIITALVLIRVVAVALRPLNRMTALAHRIGAGARGRRLRPTRPDTDLGRTAVAFDEMLDALEAAESTARQAEDRMRQFLTDASHDLRTPLAGVIAGSDALLRADFDQLERADREQRLVAIVRQARQAARLVDDLLVMTRLGAEPRPQQAVELVELIRQQLDTVEVRRPDVARTLTSDIPRRVVLVDPDGLRRAVSNLLDNAADASPPGGRLTVDIAGNGRQATVTVLDDGPGVPADERERIFDRFVRLSRERSGDGTGLGLPIARAIVRRDGGDVVCVPGSAGSGGHFELTLPIAGGETEPSVAADLSQPLVVDHAS